MSLDFLVSIIASPIVIGIVLGFILIVSLLSYVGTFRRPKASRASFAPSFSLPKAPKAPKEGKKGEAPPPEPETVEDEIIED
jgi:hypothetical protein